MTIDEGKMDEGNSMRGEIEIEKIPTRTIEARSKDLVPVFDYFRSSKIRHARCVKFSFWPSCVSKQLVPSEFVKYKTHMYSLSEFS